MRRLSATACAAALLAALTGCSPQPPAGETPVTAEAAYRLSYNDELVGHALFLLHIEPGGTYRIEAYTTPAGKLEHAAAHEVLESSRGAIEANRIRPRRFDQGVLDGGRVNAVNLVFDWHGRTLRLVGDDRLRSVSLLPGTHDRLSYLLAARRLASAGAGADRILIASPTATEDNRLEVVDEQPIEVPAGRFRATAVRRFTPEAGERRTLWFNSAVSPLPLRIAHERDGNSVEMALETYTQSTPE